MSMFVIFLNCGFAIMDSLGIFGSDISSISTIYHTRLSWLATPYAVIALAGTLAVGAGLLGIFTRGGVTDKVIIYGTFAGLYWGSVMLAGATVFAKVALHFPGTQLFIAIFWVACGLIFVMTLVQMAAGGQKTYV